MAIAEERVGTDTVRPPKRGPEPFTPESMLWEGGGDNRMLLVFGGAMVMQAMHPAIGHAVGQTREYRTDPWGRFQRSITSLQKWVYAGDGAIEEGKRLRELHKKFNGVDDNGRTYHALDPEPWAWVHLTAFERAVALNKYFVDFAPSQDDVRRLYAEILQLGRILNVPERMLPPTVEDYWRYFDDMVATKLEAHPTALDVLEVMKRTPRPGFVPDPLRSVWKPFGRSAGRLQHFITVGTFPPAVREILGLSWSDADERKLRRIGTFIRKTFPRLPERVRYMPIAYRARKAARSRAA